MTLVLDHIGKSYGGTAVLEDFSLTAEDGEIVALLGESGCGKTTLLNCVAGTVPHTGEVRGRPERVSYVFQEPRLLPNLTVEQNVAYVLRAALPKAEIAGRVADALEACELLPYRNYYPARLSGGMAQRVSLARAFAYPSELLLMDEPFRALDPALKYRLIRVFFGLYGKSRRTVLFVTHDLDEALLLADRVILLTKGPARIGGAFRLVSEKPSRRLSDPELLEARGKICVALGI